MLAMVKSLNGFLERATVRREMARQRRLDLDRISCLKSSSKPRSIWCSRSSSAGSWRHGGSEQGGRKMFLTTLALQSGRCVAGLSTVP